MAANPVTLRIPSDSFGGLITCVANAAYYQRVTLFIPSVPEVVFQGTGEGVPMKDQDGQTSYALGATRQHYDILAKFEFSQSGPNGPFQLAKVKDPIIIQNGSIMQIQVTSEDSTDNDDNDSYLTIDVNVG